MSKSPTAENKNFDVGGQAVMEGVMMRSPNATAVTVRRPDGSMVTKLTPFVPVKEKHPWMGKRFIRGVVNMCTMLYYGMNTLSDSTKMLGILDEEPSRFEKWLARKLGKGVDKIVMGLAVILAVVLSLGLFMALPAGLESVLKSAGVGPVGYTFSADSSKSSCFSDICPLLVLFRISAVLSSITERNTNPFTAMNPVFR